jgi:hypothetical protein
MNAPRDLPTLARRATPELLAEMEMAVDVARAIAGDVKDRRAEQCLTKLCDAFETLLHVLKASRRFER